MNELNDLSKKIAEARIKTYGDKLNLEWISEAIKEYFGDRLKPDGSIDWWSTNKNNNNEKDKKGN